MKKIRLSASKKKLKKGQMKIFARKKSPLQYKKFKNHNKLVMYIKSLIH